MASLDNLYIVISLFAVAIAIVIGTFVWNNVASVDEVFEANSHTQTIKGNTQGFFNSLDFVFVLLYFAYHLGILVLAFFLRTHPIIYVAGFLLIVIIALISPVLSNTYETFIGNEDIATTANGFTAMNWIMANLPMLEVILGFVTIIILAGMARQEGVIG